MKRRGERGFTLIELMVALVVSALLVGMILAIFSRMSLAYRGQQQIAGVQQVLAAARATIELDAKQAGYAMPQGFTVAFAPASVQSPVQITDSNTGPDRIAFFYADPTGQAAITDVTGWPSTPAVTVDSTSGFTDGDLVVLSTADIPTLGNPNDPNSPPTSAKLATYHACVLRIAPGGVNPGAATLTFETLPPWGMLNSIHCTALVARPSPANPPANPPPKTMATMIYKFVAHAYRIDPDPARAAIGPLQGSLITGGLLRSAADTWTDLAYGFTDLQTALQVYDHGSDPTDTLDQDSDGDREWYSDGTQDTMTGAASPLISPDGLLQMSISLVVRTDRDVEGIATAATPQLIDPAIPNNNTIGNHPSVPLPSATDPALQGARIYRYTTFLVDFRNLGVGR